MDGNAKIIFQTPWIYSALTFGTLLRRYNLLKTLLFCYLSLAVLLPSYQGFENGQEFHFFEIVGSEAELPYHDNSRHGLWGPEEEHSHSLVYYVPSHRKQKGHVHEASILCVHGGNAESPVAAGYYVDSRLSVSCITDIYKHTASGRSPPAV